MEYLHFSHFPCVCLSALAVGTFLACSGVGAEDIPYGIASWPTAYGNHRARLQVSEKADAVWVHLPWRRRDPEPEKKSVIIVDAATGKEVKNVARVEVNREYGDLVFQPDTAPGEYHVYYMPYSENTVNWQYSTEYAKPQATADAGWLERNALTPERLVEGKWKSLPQAKVLEFQARSDFHRFDPMEVLATAEETKALVAKYPDRSYLLFPEDRKYPIRMTDDLPLRWIRNGPSSKFTGEAQRGEFYVFQIGVYAARQTVEDLAVEISDLKPGKGKSIPPSAFHAFNLRGIDWLGRPMKKVVTVPLSKVQALWFGVQIPKDATAGSHRGEVTVRPKGVEPTTVELTLEVKPAVIKDGGVNDLWRLARLQWLDSKIGLDDEVVAPYTPLVVKERTVRCLGRSVRFAETGLPESIVSNGREILAKPVSITAEVNGSDLKWAGGKSRVKRIAPGAATCEASAANSGFSMKCQARMEFDGYINYRIVLNSKSATEVKDLRLEIPLRREVATYMMGLGRKGGHRPKEWQWKWDAGRANNMVWMGDWDAGMQCKLKGPQDTWDIYNLTAGKPDSWDNGGKGGCTVTEEGETVRVRAYSGPRTVKAGEEIEFRFALLITPVKPLNPAHWEQRYYHFYAPVTPVEEIAKTGANLINCHQGNELNPYINYPFLTTDKFGEYVKQAHEKGIKVKTYYTVRELSNYVAEMWPLRSLGFEVFADGGGGGHSWLQEHLVNHYGSAWHQPYPNGEVDAAIVTTGLSRWHNYYLEGLNWLVRNVGLDGLYLDGIGYDREIMKRVRKVMDRARPGCLIDFHSGNEFPFNDFRVSPANKYMEHFPYIDSVWFGEGYDYDETPDYWLVEISGIPFGLYGEMLQGGGNPWRGMIYGMTSRLGWGGDPRPIWKVWDDFGVQESRTLGSWDRACPVKTNHADVLATAYVKKGKTLIALASWAKEPVQCQLTIDWKALGLNPQKASLFAPAVQGFQGAALFKPGDELPVMPARGWLLIVDEEKHDVLASATTIDAYKGRTMLLEDRFDREKLGEPWQAAVSAQPKTSLKLENGAIAIEAAANVFAFAERPLPTGTTLVQCSILPGTDQGATWGPGLEVVWKNAALRINLRPPEGRFGVYQADRYWFNGVVAPGGWYHVRIRVEPEEILAEASAEGKLWYPIHTLPRDHFQGDPIAVRLGKISPGSGGEDHADPGIDRVGACAIKGLQVFGAA